MSICKNVFKINDVYDLVSAGCFVTYNPLGDPGPLWVSGENDFGNLGLGLCGIPGRVSSPVQLPGCWKYIRSAGSVTMGVRDNDTLWAWGVNSVGQLGTNNIICYSSPIQVPGTQWVMAGGYDSVSHGIKSDGTLWAWGDNTNGNLGTNNTTAYSSPIQVPGTAWCLVSSSYDRPVAIKTDGTMWTMGRAWRADASCVFSSPVQIPGTGWCKAFAMNANNFALKTDNTLWVWGLNNIGQLGQNNITTVAGASSPVQVPGTWCDVAMTSNCTYIGVKNDGTLWAWGRGTEGQLGNGAATNRSSPVQIPGTTWQRAGAGQVNTFAIKTDGTLWGMGQGSGGKIPNEQNIAYSSPIQVPGSWVRVYESDVSTFLRRC